MSDEIDFSKDNLDDTMNVYGVLLCDLCKIKLKNNCLPIINKLNKGFPPTMREMVKLNRSLCKDCLKALTNEKQKQARKK